MKQKSQALKENIFQLENYIDENTVNAFKAFLRENKEGAFNVRLKSMGGNIFSTAKIERFIYTFKNQGLGKFIMAGETAGSAAFKVFARGDERIITPKSEIYFHLPVPRTERLPHEIARERDIYANTILSLFPKLSREEIEHWNQRVLPIDFMVEKDIITKIVPVF